MDDKSDQEYRNLTQGEPIPPGKLLGAFLAGEDWGEYPNPHYDEHDCCPCPDHKAQRRERMRKLLDEIYWEDDLWT